MPTLPATQGLHKVYTLVCFYQPDLSARPVPSVYSSFSCALPAAALPVLLAPTSLSFKNPFRWRHLHEAFPDHATQGRPLSSTVALAVGRLAHSLCLESEVSVCSTGFVTWGDGLHTQQVPRKGLWPQPHPSNGCVHPVLTSISLRMTSMMLPMTIRKSNTFQGSPK